MGSAESKIRREIGARLRRYEECLERFEDHLRALQRKIDKAQGESQAELGSLLADVEQEADRVRGAGEGVLRALQHAVEVGQGALARAEERLRTLAPPRVPAREKGKAAVRRATIEVKAIRHGVRVGLRMAARVSRRAKAAKG